MAPCPSGQLFDCVRSTLSHIVLHELRPTDRPTTDRPTSPSLRRLLPPAVPASPPPSGPPSAHAHSYGTILSHSSHAQRVAENSGQYKKTDFVLHIKTLLTLKQFPEVKMSNMRQYTRWKLKRLKWQFNVSRNVSRTGLHVKLVYMLQFILGKTNHER